MCRWVTTSEGQTLNGGAAAAPAPLTVPPAWCVAPHPSLPAVAALHWKIPFEVCFRVRWARRLRLMTATPRQHSGYGSAEGSGCGCGRGCDSASFYSAAGAYDDDAATRGCWMMSCGCGCGCGCGCDGGSGGVAERGCETGCCSSSRHASPDHRVVGARKAAWGQ